MIEIAAKSGRVSLDNATAPQTDRRRLPEADLAHMEQFLTNISVILPVVGLDMLKPQPRATQVEKPLSVRTQNDVEFEITHKSGVSAFAVEEDGEFIVLEGSQALTDTEYATNNYKGLKERLITSGTLVPAGPGRLRFTRPQAFKSPSAAAAVVLDRNTNGRTQWQVKGLDETYHTWQEKVAKDRETDQQDADPAPTTTASI